MAEGQDKTPKFLQKIKQIKLVKNKKFLAMMVAIFVCILALVFLNFGSTKTSTTSTATTQATATASSSSALEYANAVATNLQEIISQVKGVSNAKVVVVVESSPVVEYLTEDATTTSALSTSSTTGKAVVYDKQGSNYQPVAVAEYLPKITGILVVASGVGDLKIKYNLLNAISAVYNLNISSIDILEGK